MEQAWFEMRDVRRRKLSTAVWIPLRASHKIERGGKWGFTGFKEDFYGVGTLAVPIEAKTAAEELGWSEIGLSHEHSGGMEKGEYVPCDIYQNYRGDFTGIHLVLDQPGTSLDPREWHLHQDIVVSLKLKREGDIWVCPYEGYVDVARLRRQDDETPFLLEIRAEYLKDYLCARQMALYVTSYRSRDTILENINHIKWQEKQTVEGEEGNRWEGRILEIHEGGHPFGSEMAVFHMGRTDVDPEEDVPTFDFPSDANIESKSWKRKYDGRKLYRVMGELWRNEWVDPGPVSPRIRGDELPPTAFFITDAEGKRENRLTLKEGRRWLWFRPEVMMVLAHRRGGSLGWYTKDTGGVSCSPGSGVHFGVNKLGLVNVYAKDIALLPEWQQVIWSGYSVGPDGGVSDELLAAQMRAKPADTQAPEAFLQKGIELVNNLSKERLGITLFREHEQIPQLIAHSHRFRAIDRAGVLSLAKDLARLTADSLDTAAIQTIVSPPKGTKWGSLKSLQNLMAKQVDPDFAKILVGPLVGIYELRHGDAHLQSSEISEAFALARVDQGLPTVFQGYHLLNSCVASLYTIAEVLGKMES